MSPPPLLSFPSLPLLSVTPIAVAPAPVKRVQDQNGSLSSAQPTSPPYLYKVNEDIWPITFQPDEQDTTLSSIAKLQVLKHSLMAFTTTGPVDFKRGAQMQTNNKGFQLAQQFFDLNPTLAVSSLLKILWECNRVACENPVEDSGYKPHFSQRAAAESLTYFIRYLENINGSLALEYQLPGDIRYLPESVNL